MFICEYMKILVWDYKETQIETVEMKVFICVFWFVPKKNSEKTQIRIV